MDKSIFNQIDIAEAKDEKVRKRTEKLIDSLRFPVLPTLGDLKQMLLAVCDRSYCDGFEAGLDFSNHENQATLTQENTTSKSSKFYIIIPFGTENEAKKISKVLGSEMGLLCWVNPEEAGVSEPA